jgi:hypothetical protein
MRGSEKWFVRGHENCIHGYGFLNGREKMNRKLMVTVLACLCVVGSGAFAQILLQNDQWYEGPPADPFNDQDWADYYPGEFRGDQLAAVLEAAPSDYPLAISQIDLLVGNDCNINLGAFRLRIYEVWESQLPIPFRQIWLSPDIVGWDTFRPFTSGILQVNLQSLWPSQPLPVINSGKFIVSVEMELSQGLTDVCADQGYPQVSHANLIYYNPIYHGGIEDRWQWVFAEDAGLSKAITHNFVIRAHCNTNVPPVYLVPATSPIGIIILLAGFSGIFGGLSVVRRLRRK